jgi:hypothetical protein
MDAYEVKLNLQWLGIAKFKKSIAESLEERKMHTKEILRIKNKLKGIKPIDSHMDCVGCNS